MGKGPTGARGVLFRPRQFARGVVGEAVWEGEGGWEGEKERTIWIGEYRGGKFHIPDAHAGTEKILDRMHVVLLLFSLPISLPVLPLFLSTLSLSLS